MSAFLSLPFAGVIAGTGLAASIAALGGIEVVRSIKMAFFTRISPSIDSRRAFSSKDVDPDRYRFEMPWITAGAIATQVVERRSVRNAADEILVDDPMSDVGSIANTDAPIPFTGRSWPEPTGIRIAHHSICNLGWSISWVGHTEMFDTCSRASFSNERR